MILLALFFVVGHVVAIVVPGDRSCHDMLTNCAAYSPDSCTKFPAWAKLHCNNTCNICNGPEPPCEDSLKNCQGYGKDVCNQVSLRHWAKTNCRYYCRLCSAAALAAKDARTTTVSPQLCVDKVDCRLYIRNIATDCCNKNEGWARTNCMSACKFCKGVATPAPACVDTIPNCASFGLATCKNSKFTLWVKDKCPKFCGICGGSPVAHPNVGQITACGTVQPQTHVPVGPTIGMRTPPMPGK